MTFLMDPIKADTAGRKWYYWFTKRNPQLCLRQPRNKLSPEQQISLRTESVLKDLLNIQLLLLESVCIT